MAELPKTDPVVAARVGGEEPKGVGGFLQNNNGLLFGALIGIGALFGMEDVGGFLPWLFAGAAIIAGYATDSGNPNSVIGGIVGMFSPSKSSPAQGVGKGDAQVPATTTPAAETGATTTDKAAADKAAVDKKQEVTNEIKLVTIRVDKNGKLTTATEGEGLLQISAFMKDSKAFVDNVSITATDGRFAMDGTTVVINKSFKQNEMILPVKDGNIDVNSDAFRSILPKLREAASPSTLPAPAPAPTPAPPPILAPTPPVVTHPVTPRGSDVTIPLLPTSLIIPQGKGIVTFMVNQKFELVKEHAIKPESAGLLKVIAKTDGTVLDVAVAGKDGKFVLSDKGNYAVNSVPSGTKLPITNGEIDFTNKDVQGIINQLRAIAESPAIARNVSSAQGVDVVASVGRDRLVIPAKPLQQTQIG